MPVIIGTGGHVDHGKTSLVTCLTGHGEDLDRWQEEKQRGLTIDIGFAFLDDGQGGKISFVDVPGHEDFVNNMIVGASGIDIGLLVIAADDSVMPQTVEHLEIMDLLGIRDFAVAVSKVDLMDEETVAIVEEEISDLFAAHSGITLHGVFHTSCSRNKGIETLRAFLVKLAADIGSRKSTEGFFRLPIDRAFVVKGFGTVVTGSLVSGTVKTGDEVEVVPLGVRTRVRNIEVDDRTAETAVRGQRTALNLAGIERDDICRGHQVCFPGLVQPAFMVNALVTPAVSLPEPIANRADVRFMAGTGSAVSRLEILSAETIVPSGGEYTVQIRFREPVPVKSGDRFILRRLSPELTIAGGTVLEIAEVKATRARADRTGRIERLAHADLAGRVEEFFRRSVHAFGQARDAALEVNIPFDKTDALIAGLGDRLVRHASGFLHSDTIALYTSEIKGVLARFHKASPYDTGAPAAHIRSSLPAYFNNTITDFVLDQMLRSKAVSETDHKFALGTFKLALSAREQELAMEILTYMNSTGAKYATPNRDELADRFGKGERFDNTWRFLTETNKLVKIDRTVFLTAETIVEIKEIVRAGVAQNGSIDVKTLRDKLDNSRKFAIAIMEYLDKSGFTQRVGDVRRLKQ